MPTPEDKRVLALSAADLGPTKRFLRAKLEWTSGSESKEGITRLFPDGWLETLPERPVWVTGYRIFLASGADLTLSSATPIDVLGSRALLALIDIDFHRPGLLAAADWQGEEPLRFVSERASATERFSGACLLMLTRQGENEDATLASIEAAAALTMAFCGRNVAYDSAFQFVVESDTKFWAITNSIQNPQTFGAPDIRQQTLDVLRRATPALAQLAEPTRNRLLLSLRWWHDGWNRSGADGFVYRWVAIEVISMPTATNVRPLNEMLSKIYDLDMPEVRETFLMGRCQDVRSKIVHEGLRAAADADVLDYLDALYLDLLYETIGLHPMKRAKQAMTDSVRLFLTKRWDSQ